MAVKKLTVVISQSQGKNPIKRQLEEELAAMLIMDPEIEVSLVPHLYDLHAEHTGTLFLRSVPGDLVVLSWLYPRAARWTLDRQNIKGHPGQTLLMGDEDEEFEDDEIPPEEERTDALGAADVPDRKLYCIDLRNASDAQTFLDEIRRIAAEATVQTVELMQWISGNPRADQLQRYILGPEPTEPPAQAKRRWYPVIDYDRCTNCMECIDFCLFGVYGVDHQERILVEEQDNCKKGCPACSRVCPENAIIFPGHKSPGIAGSDGEVGGLKLDLSKLFGAPNALDTAVQERDLELIRDGREAVGASVGLPKRQEKPSSQRDDLDDLIDSLDDLNL